MRMRKQREAVRVGLTQVTDTGGYKTCPYQCLVMNVVSLSLEYIIANQFYESQNYRGLLIEAETTHESGRNREE